MYSLCYVDNLTKTVNNPLWEAFKISKHQIVLMDRHVHFTAVSAFAFTNYIVNMSL